MTQGSDTSKLNSSDPQFYFHIEDLMCSRLWK